MAREAVEQILGRAIMDQAFRQALFSSPDKALAEYDLTEEELAGLRALDAESLDSAAGALDAPAPRTDSTGIHTGCA